MDPVISQAIATLIGALATALLLFASSQRGPNSSRKRNRQRDEANDDNDAYDREQVRHSRSERGNDYDDEVN